MLWKLLTPTYAGFVHYFYVPIIKKASTVVYGTSRKLLTSYKQMCVVSMHQVFKKIKLHRSVIESKILN